MRRLLSLIVLVAAPASAREALRVSSGFGVRVDPFGGSRAAHRGIDLPVARGTPVLAAAPGVVTVASSRGGYGFLVEIAHPDGSRTRYGHLSRILVGVGSAVGRGETVGLAGSTGRSTGSHLHFEFRIDGRAVDPLGYMGDAREPDRAAPTPKTAPAAPPPPYRSAFSFARAGHAGDAAPALPGGADSEGPPPH